jgi:hypothetical protein|tara:strand:- start:1347 stop:1517 length:171 start_codon:yes stop_codon:yes gene_type:complete
MEFLLFFFFALFFIGGTYFWKDKHFRRNPFAWGYNVPFSFWIWVTAFVAILVWLVE